MSVLDFLAGFVSGACSAMGVGGDEVYNALRVSLGRYTTGEDIDAFVEAAKKVLHW